MNKYKYKVYNGKTLKKFFANIRIYILFILFVTGIIVGALLSDELSLTDGTKENIFDLFLNYKNNNDFFINFLCSVASNIIFVIFNVFFALSLIGYPFIMCIPLLRGMGLGLLSGYLYSSYRLTGFGYLLLMVYPGAVISTVALIYACNNSCEYSRNAYLKSIKGRGQFEKNETRVYLIRQLVFSVVCIASSLTDTLMHKIFSGLFIF